MTTENENAPASETPKELAARLRVNKRTVWSWINTGVKVQGRTVKLLARRVGARWTISREAWETFDAQCNPGAASVPESPTRLAARLRRETAELAKILGR